SPEHPAMYGTRYSDRNMVALLTVRLLGQSVYSAERNHRKPKNSNPDKTLNPSCMSLTLRTDFGCTEAIIDAECGLKRFYEVADILSDDLEIKFTREEDDFDTLTWYFDFRNHTLTLHYNIYTGISIYPHKFREAPRKDNEAVVEIARFLESRLLVHS